MRTILSTIKKTSLCGTALVLLVLSPLALASSNTFADGNTPPCTAPANNQNGVHWPVGADAGTFVYQCDGPYAGYYTNAYYVYDPITTQRTALYSPDYSYDCATGKWSMTEWDYSPASGTFISSRVTPSTAPGLATGCPAPVVSSGEADSGVSNTGPDSSNNAGSSTILNGTTTNSTALGMSNGIYSDATTGNTFVIGNTAGGSATSGDAQSIANIANLLQSTSNVFGPNTITFTANINGDVNGDFMFDPSALINNTGPASQNSASNNLQINTNNTNDTTAQISNTINVSATSGNATVADNTNGGDAVSGNAEAIVNLMNLINSTVSAGKSFIGVVNINGDLNGDLLLPQNFIDQLLASTGPGSTDSAAITLANNSTTTNNTTQGITNNVTSSAQSGAANVSNNTNAGSAASGSANTKVTILNLTGSSVVGSNDLLVFVNVLGHWVGMIVNAPAGSTAASLGGGISSTGPNSSNSTSDSVTDSSSTTNTANLGINNDVSVSARSGDASVTGNTTGGNATSGSANTAMNILNLAGSNLNLSSWFGILFINVFGNWNGSFGINTSAGNPAPTPVATTQAATTSSVGNSMGTTFASFIDHAAASSASGTATPGHTNINFANASVLGTSTKKIAAAALPTPDNTTHASYLLPAIGVSIAALMLIGERVSAIRKRQ